MEQNRDSSNVYWVLLDADNPYRVAYYGGFDEDPSLPFMTSLSEAIAIRIMKAPEKRRMPSLINMNAGSLKCQ